MEKVAPKSKPNPKPQQSRPKVKQAGSAPASAPAPEKAAAAQANQKKRARSESNDGHPGHQANKRRKILESLLQETKSRDAALEAAAAGGDDSSSKTGKSFLYKSSFRDNAKDGANNAAQQKKWQRSAMAPSDESDGEEKSFPRTAIPNKKTPQKPQQQKKAQPEKQQDKPEQPQKGGSAANTPNKAKPAKEEATATPQKDESSGKLSDMQAKMKAKLDGGRFRFINEDLYTTQGKKAFETFQKEPELFDVYHEGYRSQVEKWPENPLDILIKYLQGKPEKLIVADFGCGEARLAQSVKQKVHSFDLVARNEFITACDIANVPLQPATVDIAIFSLSLMGTNFMDFLKEAHRVLKIGGELKIAEVKSRFDEYSTFIKAMRKMGFDLLNTDDTNTMFVMFDFLKTARKSEVIPVTLKPCRYKKR